jgi:hypothetical protein
MDNSSPETFATVPERGPGRTICSESHHTLAMAGDAANRLFPGGTFGRARQAEHRQEFETHVVED